MLAASWLAGPTVLRLVMGKAFEPAAAVMTWQVGAAVIGVFALPLEPMLISLGKPGAAVRVRLAVSAAFLAMLPFLVTQFGLIGAGAGLAAATGALALGMLWFILRENGTRHAAATPAPDLEERLKGDD
jgi:O-antigen/teichoic acid export membrane protein